jgi:hypothetical protein
MSISILDKCGMFSPEAPGHEYLLVILQVHIKHVGTAGMLFNPTPLRGIAPKIQKLAVRELQISARHEDSLGKLEHSLPPLGPGPAQPVSLPNGGTTSCTSSEEPSPIKRLPSTLPDIKEAPVVDIVPGVKVLQTPACFDQFTFQHVRHAGCVGHTL